MKKTNDKKKGFLFFFCSIKLKRNKNFFHYSHTHRVAHKIPFPFKKQTNKTKPFRNENKRRIQTLCVCNNLRKNSNKYQLDEEGERGVGEEGGGDQEDKNSMDQQICKK